jgi:Protein of unknown function (DUF3306)
MTDPENLLARWSRRKSDARASEGDTGPAPHDSDADASGSGGSLPSDAPPPLDLTSLPNLESISAETDLRAFLGQGVPAELTVAALRRGWSADPAIRDFIGLSENSWDFNAPGEIPGFGSLEPGAIQRLLAQLTGGGEMNEPVAPASAAPPPLEQATPQPTEWAASSDLPQDRSANDLSSSPDRDAEQHYNDPALIVSADGTDVATSKVQLVHELDVRTPSRQHRHGGALPRFDAN